MKSHALAMLITIAAGLSAGCSRELPPWGQVEVIVDTDLPAPSLAGRLRIDLYDANGRWYDSRDVGRPNASDWPATFTLWSDDKERETDVLVRLRVYPEGKTRRYRGERFVAGDPWIEPPIAKDLAELCAGATELPLGESRWVRRGNGPITILCPGLQTDHGSAAVYVDIPQTGDYRFAMLDADPYGSQVTLAVRTACDDGSTNVACAGGTKKLATGQLEVLMPDVTLHLEPGRYWLVTGGHTGPGSAADLLLGAARHDRWGDVAAPPESQPVVLPEEPRLVIGGADVTPELEPEPAVTVDRLVRVRVAPDSLGSVRVVLRGACAGTMARLGPEPPHQLVALDLAETCIDVEKQRLRLTPSAIGPDGAVPPSERDRFALPDRPCPAPGPASTVACVPGGAFVFGDAEFATPLQSAPSAPERLAYVRTFWMDRHEVTIGRWRQAVAMGLALDWEDSPKDGTELEGPLYEHCLWSHEPGPFEEYPAACLSHLGARAFCQMAGGDLPTEAQWEYAATKAGRQHETEFPWGNDPPACVCEDASGAQCHAPVFSRGPEDTVFGACLGADRPIGPAPVWQADGFSGDVTEVAPGELVFGLSGNVREWARDSGRPYHHPCWLSAGVTNPECVEAEAGAHVTRGGSWLDVVVQSHGVYREVSLNSAVFNFQTGFRCVYPEEPPW